MKTNWEIMQRLTPQPRHATCGCTSRHAVQSAAVTLACIVAAALILNLPSHPVGSAVAECTAGPSIATDVTIED